jgi:hypothetical protein
MSNLEGGEKHHRKLWCMLSKTSENPKSYLDVVDHREVMCLTSFHEKSLIKDDMNNIDPILRPNIIKSLKEC